MSWFKPQQEFIDWAGGLLREADREYAAALADWRNPARAWCRDSDYWRLMQAHSKRGILYSAVPGAGKSGPTLFLVIKKMKETKRSAIWVTRTPLKGVVVVELMERGRDIPELALNPLRIIILQGSARERREALERVRDLSGKVGFLVVCNVENLWLPHGQGEALAFDNSQEGRILIPEAREDQEEEEEEDKSADSVTNQLAVHRLATREIIWSSATVDEAHAQVSNKANKGYSEVFARLQADWRFALTGTPFPYKPRQFASLIEWTQPRRHFRSVNRWVKENFVLKGERVKDVTGDWQATHARLRREVMFTNDLSDLGCDLPPVEVIHHYVDAYPEQARLYQDMKKGVIRALPDDDETAVPIGHIFNMITSMKQVAVDPRLVYRKIARARPGSWLHGMSWDRKEGTTSPKIDCIIKSAMEDLYEISPGVWEKGVVYTQWTQAAYLLCDDMKQRGLKADTLTGDLSSKITIHEKGVWGPRLARMAALNEGDLDVLIFNDACSEGINLQRANHIWFLDLPWSPARVIQAIGRIRRPPKKGMPPQEKVYVHLVITKGTIEEKTLLPRLAKAAYAAGLFGEGVDAKKQSLLSFDVFKGDLDAGDLLTRSDFIDGL